MTQPANATAAASEGSKGMLWGGRVLTALPSLMLLGSAAGKLASAQPVVDNFAHFGFAPGINVPIGVIELLSVVIYLVPRTAVLGAVLLTGYLGGAVVTHLRVGETPMSLAPAIIGALFWGGLWMRDARIRALLPLR